jgi:tetratricopeptide (TPR) repeat protein
VIFYVEVILKKIFVLLAFFSMVSTSYAGNTLYCVQVLMTSNLESAVNTYDKLKTHESARVEKINDGYAVRIGYYRNKIKAASTLKKIKKTYSDAFVKPCVKNRTLIVHDKNSQPSPSGHDPAKKEEIRIQSNPKPPVPVAENRSEITKAPVAGNVTIPEQNLSNPSLPVADNKPETTKAPAINVEDYLKTGMQYYYDHKYDSAISSLSQYISLSPNASQHAAVILTIGKSLEEMNRHRAALTLYGRIIEQYPNTPEASLSMIAIADIGVDNPALRYPISVKGIEYFRDPISAYDAAVINNAPEQMTEHIKFQKSRYFWKTGQYRESCDSCTTLLKEFPNTAHRKEIIGILKASMVSLIDQYHQSGDHISAANIFFQAKKRGMIGTEDIDILLKSALSFAHLGFYNVSSNILGTLKTKTRGKTSVDIDKAVAEFEKIKMGVAANQVNADKKWDLFQSGKNYLSSNNLSMAEQTLSQLKNTGGEAFWSKISEYALEDNKWNQKYRGYLDKK